MKSNDQFKSASRRSAKPKLERLENRWSPCLATGQDIAAMAIRSDGSTGLVGDYAKYCNADS